MSETTTPNCYECKYRGTIPGPTPDESPDPSEVRTNQRRRILAEAKVPELVRAAERVYEIGIELEWTIIRGNDDEIFAALKASGRAADRLRDLTDSLDPDIAALVEAQNDD